MSKRRTEASRQGFLFLAARCSLVGAIVCVYLLCSFALCPASAWAAERDVPAEVVSELAAVAGSSQIARLSFGGSHERPEIVWEFIGSKLNAEEIGQRGLLNLGVRLSLEYLGVSATSSSRSFEDALGTVVMDFESPGELPAQATVSLVVPKEFAEVPLSLYAVDTKAGTYSLRQSGLFASGGYVTFMLATLEPLVLAAGEPEHLPAAFLPAAPRAVAAVAGGAGGAGGAAESELAEASPTAVQAVVSTNLAQASSAHEEVVPLPVFFLCSAAALAALVCILVWRCLRRREELSAMQQSWQSWQQGGDFTFEELPGLHELLEEKG